MINFTLASRHKDEGTRERFFYEWSIIHVALMLTSPTVPRVFRRYVQHFNILGITNDMFVHPLSDEGWESFSEHWLERYQDLLESLHNKDYVERMQPHSFGSHRFITGLSDSEVIYQQERFRSGGVKLIHFLKKRPELTQEDFNHYFRTQHASRLRELMQKRGNLVRKYVQNIPVPLDPAIFRGTLFELGSIGLYAGMEQFWFHTVHDLALIRRDTEVYDAILGSERHFVQAEGSISMVVNERVVWDFVTLNELSPQPAILNPASLEAAIDRQGYVFFDKPAPVDSLHEAVSVK